MVVAFLMWSGSELQTEGPNERMHSPLPSCTYSEVIQKESGVAGDQAAGVEGVTALKQRHTTTGNSSISVQPVKLTEYRCDVHIRVYGLQAEL